MTEIVNSCGLMDIGVSSYQLDTDFPIIMMPLLT